MSRHAHKTPAPDITIRLLPHPNGGSAFVRLGTEVHPCPSCLAMATAAMIAHAHEQYVYETLAEGGKPLGLIDYRRMIFMGAEQLLTQYDANTEAEKMDVGQGNDAPTDPDPASGPDMAN